MARVMHERRHGALTDPAGEPATDRKQAVAIDCGEAGSSDRRTPAQNPRRLEQSQGK